jgi:hypothetical protein
MRGQQHRKPRPSSGVQLCFLLLYGAVAIPPGHTGIEEQGISHASYPDDGGNCHLMLTVEPAPEHSSWMHEGGVPGHWSEGMNLQVLESVHNEAPILLVIGECHYAEGEGGLRPEYVVYKNDEEIASGAFREGGQVLRAESTL